MVTRLVECVPNFSTGRSPELLRDLVHLVEAAPGALLLNASRDVDHNRSVLSFAAPLESTEELVLALVRLATERIDLREHQGVHPRIGATDVLPFIPLAETTQAACVDLAHRVGERLGSELELPVFFYGAAARSPERRALPNLRRGGFEALLARAARGESIEPDCGPSAPHPSAGASALGVRPFLVAYNINLEGGDLALARRIAAQLRESSGGLPAVRALGLWLEEAGLAQVSMNLCDFRRTGIAEVFERVGELAGAAGVGIRESELIGLAPAEALDAELAERVALHGFDPAQQILEQRLAQLQGMA